MARDADSGEILSFRCSVSKSPQDGKKFIDSVLAVCTERPLLRVGRGPSFPHSLKSLDLYFQIDTSGTPIRQRISNFFLGGSEPRKKTRQEESRPVTRLSGSWLFRALRPRPERDRPEEHHAGGHALSNTTLIALVLAVAISPSLPHLE